MTLERRAQQPCEKLICPVKQLMLPRSECSPRDFWQAGDRTLTWVWPLDASPIWFECAPQILSLPSSSASRFLGDPLCSTPLLLGSLSLGNAACFLSVFLDFQALSPPALPRPGLLDSPTGWAALLLVTPVVQVSLPCHYLLALFWAFYK